jgi:DNA segregation ATPase FtsK/SpoIIIE, S-DNA-T family
VTSEPTGGSEDGKVIPLRAEDTATEVRTAESPGPSYADLTDGRAQRRPIIPGHWRTWRAAREHVRLAAARHAHAAAYHGIRAPGYVVLTAWWALVGIARTVGLLLAWWHVPDLTRLERQAAADGLLSDHLRIHKAGREVRTARGLILAVAAAVVVAALTALSYARPWVGVLVGAVAVPLLARVGRRLLRWSPYSQLGVSCGAESCSSGRPMKGRAHTPAPPSSLDG